MQSIRTLHVPHSLPECLRTRLPLRLCDAVARCTAPRIEEIRLHADRYATVSCGNRNYATDILLSPSEMEDLLCRMCNHSLYAFSESINRGFLSLGEGVRVGVVGSAAVEKEQIVSVSAVTGLIIRIPHAIPADAAPLMELLTLHKGAGGLLLYAPPGGGKTTVLRALARTAASLRSGFRTVVVDARCELCGTLDGKDLNLDLLVGYPKAIGIEIAVRSLGAQLILCDEIGDPTDARAILAAANCGVPLVATAHAASLEELLARPSIRPLHEAAVFSAYVGLERTVGKALKYNVQPRGASCSAYDREGSAACSH